MAKAFYVGDNNDVARKVKAPYAELGGVARAIVEGYIGVNDIARKTFRKDRPSGWFTFYDIPSFPSGGGVKTYSFPFTTLDGLNFSSIVIDDSNMATIYERMYFDNTIVYSQIWDDGFSNNYPAYWKGVNDKSIYLDDLKLGVDISVEAYEFLCSVAYPDDSISGKPQTYFLKAGTYTFNDTIVSGAFGYNNYAPIFSIDINFDIPNAGRSCSKIEYWYDFDMVENHTIYYTTSDSSTAHQLKVYWAGWYASEEGRYGWGGYNLWRYIHVLSDVQVSRSIYDWWVANTTIGDTGGGDTGDDTEDNYNSYWIKLVDASTGSILSNVYTKHPADMLESYVEIHEYAILPEHPEGAGTGSTSSFDKKISYASFFLNGTENYYPGDIMYVYGDTTVYVYFEN